MIVDDFNRITGTRLDLYIAQFGEFVSTHLPKFVGYYSGSISSLDSVVINQLNDLMSQANDFNEVVVRNERRFNNAEYWEVAEVIDDIRIRLETIYNTPRWVRSTISPLDVNTNTEIDAVLPSLNTLEDLAADNGYSDPDNSWVRIALRNDLDETDYTTDGGNVLKINVVGNASMIINDVVDIMYGDNVYGKDILRTITYENDDLVTVAGEDCMLQCYEILVSMTKGDSPEHPEMGLSSAMGGNIATFSYPTVLRQLHRTVYRDDSVKAISIVKFESIEDIIVMDVLLESKFGGYLKTGITL